MSPRLQIVRTTGRLHGRHMFTAYDGKNQASGFFQDIRLSLSRNIIFFVDEQWKFKISPMRKYMDDVTNNRPRLGLYNIM